MPRLIRQPIPGDPRDPQSLTALLRRYLIWMETHHFAAGTARVRRLQLSRFILWCHDRSVTRAKDVTPEMIARFQRHLFYYRQHSGEPLSVSSQSHWLTSLRGWFSWMKQQQVIEHHPTADMRLPRQEKRLPRHALSEQEVEAVLAQPDITTPVGLRTRALLETLYSTGMRRTEALASAPLGLGPPPRCGADPSGQGYTRIASHRSESAPWPGSTSTCVKRGRSWCKIRRKRCCLSPPGRAAASQQCLVAGAAVPASGGYPQDGRVPFVSPHGRLLDVRRRGGHPSSAGNSGACQPARLPRSTRTCRSASCAKCMPSTHPGRLFRASPQRRQYARSLLPPWQPWRWLAGRLGTWLARPAETASGVDPRYMRRVFLLHVLPPIRVQSGQIFDM